MSENLMSENQVIGRLFKNRLFYIDWQRLPEFQKYRLSCAVFSNVSTSSGRPSLELSPNTGEAWKERYTNKVW